MKHMKLNFNKGFRQFLMKSIVFAFLFIAISLIIGQKIVESSLLYGFKIFIYGGMGKILLFSIVGFIILYRKRLLKLKSYKYDKENIVFIIISIIAVITFHILESVINFVPVNWTNTILIHALFLSIFVFLALGVFGFNFMKDFSIGFKREITYFLIFGVVVYSLMYQVWKLWPYLSLAVLNSVKFLFNLFRVNAVVMGDYVLIVNGFAASIGEACSGVYSMFIFASLYIFAVLLDWKKINKLKASLAFIPAVLGAFAVNILRVFLLFVFGAYISKTIALGLYHSYTGMLFFLAYFGIFWWLSYGWMKKDFKLNKYNKVK